MLFRSELRSSALLQERLKQEGFAVEAGVAGIPTAFVATAGSGSPVIAVLAEFDALPGASQEAVPEKKVRPGATAGHACGHHLFGAGSVQAAVAIKDWLRAMGRPGTVRLYGTRRRRVDRARSTSSAPGCSATSTPPCIGIRPTATWS